MNTGDIERLAKALDGIDSTLISIVQNQRRLADQVLLLTETLAKLGDALRGIERIVRR
jgi:hypothetical protein